VAQSVNVFGSILQSWATFPSKHSVTLLPKPAHSDEISAPKRNIRNLLSLSRKSFFGSSI